MSFPANSLEDLTGRGYTDDQARDIVSRALDHLVSLESSWNCANDCLASESVWRAAVEQATEDHILEGFKSGEYVVTYVNGSDLDPQS